jgi:hypothetical protein
MRLAEVCLKRARTAPLKIWLNVGEFNKQRQFSRLIAPYIQNTVTLEVSGLRSPRDLATALPKSPRSMLNLQTLDLSLSIHAPDWDASGDPFEPFPPSLKHLLLYDIPLYPSILNLGTLTEFFLHNYRFNQPLDTLFNILEGNSSLKRVVLRISFRSPTLCTSQRRVPINNKFQHLSITGYELEEIRALISAMPLQRGADLEIKSLNSSVGLNNFLSCIPSTHLAILQSPTRVASCEGVIQLSGPNGSFSFSGLSASEMSLVGLSPLSFNNVRELRFGYPKPRESATTPRVFDPSPFPALETLAIEHDASVSTTLSTFLSLPESSPSLKTLAFLDCKISKGFMKKLAQFASDRKSTTSAWLHRIVILYSNGTHDANHIHTLGKHVPVVEVRFGAELPTDLT